MAQVSPDTGIPTIAPTGAPANDYQRIDANPAQFGGLIAQGEEKLGAGAISAGKYWGSIQTDDASNNYQKEASALAEKVKTLRGQDALNAQEGSNKELDDLYSKYRGQLATPDQQLQFDNQNRAFTDRYIRGQLNSHFVQQGQEFGLKTTDDATKVAAGMAATAGSQGNEATLAVARAKALDAEMKRLQLSGTENDPDARARAVQNANTTAYKTYAEAMAATGPQGALKAQQFIDRPDISKALGADYAEVKARFRAQAAEAQSHVDAADATHAAVGDLRANPAPPRLTNPTFVRYNQFLNSGDVQSALRLSEGLRTNAYWDVNHWRTGYGSDTVTRADGSVEPVTATTQITPADAERDLQRRTGLAAEAAQKTIGPAWSAMTPAAQSALTSVVYNYGHVPGDIAAAAATGDKAALASAIAAHARDNNGVNSQRRLAEAGAVLGGFGLSGPQAVAAAPTMVMPGGEPAPAAAPSTAPEEPAPALTPAAFTPGAAGPGVIAASTATPEDVRARALQNIEGRTDWTDERKQLAIARVEQSYGIARIAAEQDAKTKKEQKEQVFNEYNGLLLKGDYAGAFAKLDKDDRLDNTEKLTLQDVIEKRSGAPNPRNYGPKYHDMLNRVLAQPGDPTRVSDVADLYRAEAAGDLTEAGVGKLRTALGDIKQSVNGYGVQATKVGAINNAKRYLSFEEDTGFGVKIRDPKGEEIFDTKFLPMFEQAYDDWTIKQGKDPHEFPYFDPKRMDAFLQQLRPKTQRDQDRLSALGESQGQEAPNTPLPKAPVGINPEKWGAVVAQPPGNITHAAWGNVLADLAEKKDVDVFNASRFGRSGLKGQDLLARMGVEYTPPPGGARPEVPESARPKPAPSGREERDIPISVPLSPLLPHVPDVIRAIGHGVTRMSPEERAALEKASGKKVLGPE